MSSSVLPEITRLPDETSLTSAFDWLLLLGFPPDVAERCLNRPDPPPTAHISEPRRPETPVLA